MSYLTVGDQFVVTVTLTTIAFVNTGRFKEPLRYYAANSFDYEKRLICSNLHVIRFSPNRSMVLM